MMDSDTQDLLSLGSVFALSCLLAEADVGPLQWVMAAIAVACSFVGGSFLVTVGYGVKLTNPWAKKGQHPSVPSAISKTVRILIMLIYAMGMVDLGFTIYAAKLLGPSIEFNSLAFYFVAEGPASLSLFKFVILGFNCAVFLKASQNLGTPRFIWIPFGIYVALIVYWAYFFAVLNGLC